MPTYPTLEKLMVEGVVFLDGRTYVGVAEDRVEVQLGSTGDEVAIERYLAEHPLPSTW